MIDLIGLALDFLSIVTSAWRFWLPVVASLALVYMASPDIPGWACGVLIASGIVAGLLWQGRRRTA